MLDQDVYEATARFLIDLEHDVAHVAELGMAQASDEENLKSDYWITYKMQLDVALQCKKDCKIVGDPIITSDKIIKNKRKNN